jgi:hypothetical protein
LLVAPSRFWNDFGGHGWPEILQRTSGFSTAALLWKIPGHP